jgi:hypothetical protein
MILAVAILLTWLDAINPPGANYQVYRAPGACSDASKFERVNTAPLAVRTYQDAPTPGNWCYRVTALVGGIESAPSAPVTVLVQPAAPTGLTATPAVAAASPP